MQACSAPVHEPAEHGVRVHTRGPPPLQPSHLGGQQGAARRGSSPGKYCSKFSTKFSC